METPGYPLMYNGESNIAPGDVIDVRKLSTGQDDVTLWLVRGRVVKSDDNEHIAVMLRHDELYHDLVNIKDFGVEAIHTLKDKVRRLEHEIEEKNRQIKQMVSQLNSASQSGSVGHREWEKPNNDPFRNSINIIALMILLFIIDHYFKNYT